MQLKLIIHGHVQNVWYRASTAGVANNLGLTGYAKNLPDDSVEILAIGEKTKLEKLKHWCQTGPKHAVVERVEEEWQETPEQGYKGFSVL